MVLSIIKRHFISFPVILTVFDTIHYYEPYFDLNLILDLIKPYCPISDPLPDHARPQKCNNEGKKFAMFTLTATH